MASALKQDYFSDEKAAFLALEAIMWPNGVPSHCPHCGTADRMNRLAPQRTKATKKSPEGKVVHGLWKCYACRKQFTVRKGTVFEESHLDLHLWFQAVFLICSSKKGISANQLHRTLGCTLKTAWFLGHRIREAMREGELSVPFGIGGGGVEADETYITRRRRKGDGSRTDEPKLKVLTLVDHETGKARSRVVKDVTVDTIHPILRRNISREARLFTDEGRHYRWAKYAFASHETVNHSKEEYARGDVTTNLAEGYFSIFKKGLKAVYQHCDERHLHRYLAEFDFRYNHRVALGTDDSLRTVFAMRGARGKRLMYRDS